MVLSECKNPIRISQLLESVKNRNNTKPRFLGDGQD